MHETHAHPVRDRHGGAFTDLREPFAIQRFVEQPLFPEAVERDPAMAGQQLRKIPPDAEIREPAQQLHVAARGRQLEIAEAQKRWRHPAHDRAGLGLRMSVVEHVAHHALAGRHQRQRARRRHAEVVHRFAAQEFSDR
jgi:hypothetical protein